MTETLIMGGTMQVVGADGPTFSIADLTQHGPEYEQIETRVPDPSWETVDGHGHTHRWWVRADNTRAGSDAAETPTLVKVVELHPCPDPDCGCEGYDVEVWHCPFCGEKVEPRFTRGSKAMQTAYGYYDLTVVSSKPSAVHLDGTQVEVRYPSGPGRMLVMTGRAYDVGDVLLVSDSDDTRSTREVRFEPAMPV